MPAGDPEISNGSIVAVYLIKYPEFPQIGRVHTSTNEAVTISWFDGTFHDIWSLVKLRKGKEWKETVSKEHIILYDVEFTRGQRLKKDTQLVLREYYDKFVNKE